MVESTLVDAALAKRPQQILGQRLQPLWSIKETTILIA
jgi:hypothetical protein